MIAIDLQGKIAVVTGASGDLGRVIARTLAEAGADVAVHYGRSAEQAERTAATIRELGRRAITVPADVTCADDINALRDRVVAELGVPDIVVANAVIQYDWKPVLEQDITDYVSQFESCVLQTVHLVKAFMPAVIERGTGGRLIGINTECTIRTDPGTAAYVAGKRGMDGLYRILVNELGPHGITVNQVAPGWMRSDRIRAQEGDVQAGYAQSVPLKRAGDDQDIADAVTFLASDRADFISGAFLPVAGGRVMVSV